MSGGRFNYKQYQLQEIIDDIEKEIEKSGKPKTKEELKEDWYDEEWYKKYPEDLNHPKYSDEVIEEFKKAMDIIKKAAIYIQRIDWFLSGDDGEESFIRRLNNELNESNR